MRTGLSELRGSEELNGGRARLSRLRKGAAAYGVDCSPCPEDEVSMLRARNNATHVTHDRFRICFSDKIEELADFSLIPFYFGKNQFKYSILC